MAQTLTELYHLYFKPSPLTIMSTPEKNSSNFFLQKTHVTLYVLCTYVVSKVLQLDRSALHELIKICQ